MLKYNNRGCSHLRMDKNIFNTMFTTSDAIIRKALKNILEKEVRAYTIGTDHPANVFEEFNVQHGSARIDIALINSIMHGYEIKSDCDTLARLPEQINEFNTVFDKLTLVVGKRHLYTAIKLIPDWWGILLAKTDANNEVFFQTIRHAEYNQHQASVSIARLLWREEALQLLEEQNKATGFRSKPREFIYQRLANVVDTHTLKEKVKKILLVSREAWQFDMQLALNGG